MFEGSGSFGPILDMAKNLLNIPVDSEMITSKLGLLFLKT